MSRTYHTDPYLIRAYRLAGRAIDADWREKWDYGNAPRMESPDGWLKWHLWCDDRPTIPSHAGGWRHDKRLSHKKDRTLAHRRNRARQRECIAHETYDLIPVVALMPWTYWD